MTNETLKALRNERRTLRKELAVVKEQIRQMGWYTTIPNPHGMHDEHNRWVNENDYALTSRKFRIQRRLAEIKQTLNDAGYQR